MSSSCCTESVIYTEAQVSEIERNQKLIRNIHKRLDKIEMDVVRVSHNRDEINLIRQRIDNGHQIQTTLYDRLRAIRNDIEFLKGARLSEETGETGKQNASVRKIPTSPLLPAAERLCH
jgi:hypothetical protein